MKPLRPSSFFKLSTNDILSSISKFKSNLFDSEEQGQNELKPKAKEIYLSIVENWKRLCDDAQNPQTAFDFDKAEQLFAQNFVKIRNIKVIRNHQPNKKALRTSTPNTTIPISSSSPPPLVLETKNSIIDLDEETRDEQNKGNHTTGEEGEQPLNARDDQEEEYYSDNEKDEDYSPTTKQSTKAISSNSKKIQKRKAAQSQDAEEKSLRINLMRFEEKITKLKETGSLSERHNIIKTMNKTLQDILQDENQ